MDEQTDCADNPMTGNEVVEEETPKPLLDTDPEVEAPPTATPDDKWKAVPEEVAPPSYNTGAYYQFFPSIFHG